MSAFDPKRTSRCLIICVRHKDILSDRYWLGEKLVNAHQTKNLHHRTAEFSVGPSTVRRAGAPGTVASARLALKRVSLTMFQVRSRKQFLVILERETKRIQKSLPNRAQHWGVARKVLNIFLRSCVYSRPLAKYYRITHLEPWLELPLDSQVAAGIKTCSGSSKLPKWLSVKGLTPEDSTHYQTAARALARHKGGNPIHLEACWWRANVTRCRCAAKQVT